MSGNKVMFPNSEGNLNFLLCSENLRIPELVMSTDLLSFEHPSVLLFCLEGIFVGGIVNIRNETQCLF